MLEGAKSKYLVVTKEIPSLLKVTDVCYLNRVTKARFVVYTKGWRAVNKYVV